ncbi:hypothetical protein LPJ64_005113, partial [Coemansia asiatica]
QQQKQTQQSSQMPAASSSPAPSSASAPRKQKEKSAKPINAFIKYRSYKISELKKQYPEVSQTEISRLAGECWKTECEEIKNQFRVQYMEEKKLYDLKKTTNKRPRDTSEVPSEIEAEQADESGSITAPLPEDSTKGPGALGLPSGFDPKRRRRSLTLPPTNAAEMARAASSSPMMTPLNAKRRRCITVDMRKQLAAKTSAIIASPPMIDTMQRSQSISESALADAAAAAAVAAATAAAAAGGPSGVYGPLGFSTPTMHPSDVAASPYLSDMSPMTLPTSQTFSLPPSLTAMTTYDSVVTEDSAAMAAAAAAFDLYTSETEELVAANISTLMANTQAVVSSTPDLLTSSTLSASTPLVVDTGMLSTMTDAMSSDYFGSPQH